MSSGDTDGLGEGPGDWPLWVDVGVPIFCIALFILVNLILYHTHKEPDEQEDLPLAGINATNDGCQVPDTPKHYGSTNKQPPATSDPEPLVPAENLALSVSTEETTFTTPAWQPRPGTSAAGTGEVKVKTGAETEAEVDVGAGALTGTSGSKSTDPLVGATGSGKHRNQRRVR